MRNRKEIVTAIEAITKALRGPLDNVERRWLHEDRKDLRAELAKMDAAEPEQQP